MSFDKGRETLLELYRVRNRRPFVAIGPDRRDMVVLGMGPDGRMICWYIGSDDILLRAIDQPVYRWKCDLGA